MYALHAESRAWEQPRIRCHRAIETALGFDEDPDSSPMIESDLERVVYDCGAEESIGALSMAGIQTIAEAADYCPAEMQKAMEESAGVQISLSLCTRIVHGSIRVRDALPPESGAKPLRFVEVDNGVSEDQSTSSVEHFDEVPDDHMHWLLVSPAAPLPNGDVDNKFEGPMKGRFKVVRSNLTQREQESLLQKGWQCTFAGYGAEGKEEALRMREEATSKDRAHIMWVPLEDDGEEEDDAEFRPMPRAARRLARPPRSYRSVEERARIQQQLNEDYLDYSPLERASQLLFGVQSGTEEVQSGTELSDRQSQPHDHPCERMAAPAEQEGQAMKSKTAGEQAIPEHSILPKNAYQISCGMKYRPLRASEHEPEREIRDTTSCAIGRSSEQEAEQDSEEEYEYELCTDAWRQFANRPYYKRVRRRAEAETSGQSSSMRINMHSMGSAPPTDSQTVPSLEAVVISSQRISPNQSESVEIQSESVELNGRDQVAVALAWLPYQWRGPRYLHKI